MLRHCRASRSRLTNRVTVNQVDIVMVDKLQKRAVVIGEAIPSNCNIRKKDHEKLEKCQWLKEKMEKLRRVNVVVPASRALDAVTPPNSYRSQEQSQKSVHIVQSPQAPRPLVEDKHHCDSTFI